MPKLIRIFLKLCFLLPFTVNAQELEVKRGQLLYENHCQSCHAESIHNRFNPRAETLDELYVWIISWSTHSGLNWGEEDINDLADYLNDRFYLFDE